MSSHPSPTAVALWGGLAVLASGVALAQPAETSCIVCHADADLFDEESLAIVEGFRGDVHAELGLSCHDCHGGNPDPAVADDPTAAMDETWEPDPYRGAPDAALVPGFCGRCHSDPAYMRRFRPDARVDQEREYATSQHGEALAKGNSKVATCASCHGAHGIRRPGDPDSGIYPTRVADTCRSCHGDAEHMAGAELPDGSPLPVDQYERWRSSVHAAALLDREDLFAPTCNDCHGNHGAAPPGLESVAFVCGQCHGREASLFRASVKQAKLRDHNDYLADAGGEGCAACHEAPEPQAELTGIHSFGECAACHGNHGVVRPSLALLSPLPDTPCAFCHEPPDPESADEVLAEPPAISRNYAERRDELLAEAEAAGLSGAERFDWLVDRALVQPAHTLSGEGASEAGEDAPVLRPEFERLFDKFRIGKTSYTYPDPATGEPTRVEMPRCETCHAAEPLLADEPLGLATAGEYVTRMRELTALTARAERILLRARRGGVETREALLEIDQAVDAQIGLEVLLHTFATGEESEFAARHAEGMQHARAALVAGGEALDELAYRRRGLLVALALVVLVLAGLALKIRHLAG